MDAQEITTQAETVEAPVALNKKGKPIKVGHKDIDKRVIEKGDLFILAREKKTKHLFRVYDKELADKIYETPFGGRYGYYRHWSIRQTVGKDGHIRVRVWVDAAARVYQRGRLGQPGKTVTDPKRIVGSPVKLRPGCFGIVLGRHEQRPSQWRCIIGGRHYSVSNTTMKVLKTEEEFVQATHDVEKDNANITPEEWVRVMRDSVEIR
jgi:hypothetical protein